MEPVIYDSFKCMLKKRLTFVNRLKEAPTRFELVIEVLQTFALPLGYGALS